MTGGFIRYARCMKPRIKSEARENGGQPCPLDCGPCDWPRRAGMVNMNPTPAPGSAGQRGSGVESDLTLCTPNAGENKALPL